MEAAEHGGGNGVEDSTLEAVLDVYRDLSVGLEVKWDVIRGRVSGLLEQSTRELDEVLRLEMVALEELCAAQQGASEMRMMDTVRSLLRARNALLTATAHEVRESSDRRLRVLQELLRGTREKTSLYFMPALVPDAVGFCGRPWCADCAGTVARVNRSSPPGSNMTRLVAPAEKVVLKDLLDDFVNRNSLVDVAIVLHRDPKTLNRHGFTPPEHIFEQKYEEEDPIPEDGLCLWPALVVRPSIAADRIRHIWPTIVSFLCLVENRLTMETGRKIWDAKLKLTIYASRLELRQFVVVTARDDECEEQIPRFLGALRAVVSASEERKRLIASGGQMGWLTSLFQLT